MHISEKTHSKKDHPTTTKSKERGLKTIKIDKKKTEQSFLKLKIEETSIIKKTNKKSNKKSNKKLNKKSNKKVR